MKQMSKIFVVLVLIYLITVAVQQLIIWQLTPNVPNAHLIQSKVNAQLKFCVNQRPNLNNSCNFTVYQNELYSCTVNATDGNYQALTFNSSFIFNNTIFNITTGGLVEFTPNQSDVGNNTFTISVYDTTVCQNNVDAQSFTLQVIDVNDAPILIRTIPNQTWEEDISLLAFDLDLYFFDPDGDALTYTSTTTNNIDVDIQNDGTVIFTPLGDFTGSETVIFYAWDPDNANASSNEVGLTVIGPVEVPDEAPATSGGGGGGGGGGSVPLCLPRWYCRPFGPCLEDSLRYRECYDLNNCTSAIGQPNLTQTCEFTATCYDGKLNQGEEGIDCGGPCPACATCDDNICNNNEDCTIGLIDIPDCGGPCDTCIYPSAQTCFDSICNNNEDCTYNLTDFPDCGGPCDACPVVQQPRAITRFNWTLVLMLIMVIVILSYVARQSYPEIKVAYQQRKKKLYEERLLLEAKVSESIYESLKKLLQLIDKEDDMAKLVLFYSTIVRRYFKSLFGIKYEFTYDELAKELETRNVMESLKVVLLNFFTRSIELEFSKSLTSKEELKAMVAEFSQILAKTTKKPQITQEVKVTKGKLNALDKMFVTISRAEAALERQDINEAFKLYKMLIKDFGKLDETQKPKVHNFIARLYDEIKLARARSDRYK